MYAKIDQAIFAQGSELSARNTIWMLSDRNTRSTKVAYWQTHSCHIILTFVLLQNLTWCITSIHLLVLLCGKKVFGGQISKISTTCDIVKINHTTATIWLLFFLLLQDFFQCRKNEYIWRQYKVQWFTFLSKLYNWREWIAGYFNLPKCNRKFYSIDYSKGKSAIYVISVGTYLTIIYK